jgi:hypothetical protein
MQNVEMWCWSLYRDRDFHTRFHFDHYELSGQWHGEFASHGLYSLSPILAGRGTGGHRHWQVGRMTNTDLKPDLRWKGVKDRTFLKSRRQRSCPLPLPSQRSKIVSINLTILPFF